MNILELTFFMKQTSKYHHLDISHFLKENIGEWNKKSMWLNVEKKEKMKENVIWQNSIHILKKVYKHLLWVSRYLHLEQLLPYLWFLGKTYYIFSISPPGLHMYSVSRFKSLQFYIVWKICTIYALFLTLYITFHSAMYTVSKTSYSELSLNYFFWRTTPKLDNTSFLIQCIT